VAETLCTEQHPFPGRGSHPSTQRPWRGAWYSCRFQTGPEAQGADRQAPGPGTSAPTAPALRPNPPWYCQGSEPVRDQNLRHTRRTCRKHPRVTHSSGQIENASVTRLIGHLHTRGQTHRRELLWVRWSGCVCACMVVCLCLCVVCVCAVCLYVFESLCCVSVCLCILAWMSLCACL